MKILIIGYGITGKAIKEYFDKYQNEVFIYDEKYVDDKNYYSYEKLVDELPLFDLGIKSPGIRNNKALELINSLCKEIKSELDYGFEHMEKCYVIGVTGSNGKTSFAIFLKEFLSFKNRVFLVGNIGKPLISVIDDVTRKDIVIIELSSFQIHDSKNISLDELFITSISPNHLDSYSNLINYYADKKRAFLLTKNYNYYFIDNNSYLLNVKNKNYQIKVDYTNKILHQIKGDAFVNYLNIVINYCLNLGYKEYEIDNILKNIYLVKHRLNYVKKINNLTFINDSKSTSSASSLYCCKSYYNYNFILILGGIHKSDSFNKIKLKDDDIVLIYGQDKEKIYQEIKGIIFNDLNEIFNYLKKIKKEYYVLFSPGCSSYDQFKNYEERGEYYLSLISNMEKENE